MGLTGLNTIFQIQKLLLILKTMLIKEDYSLFGINQMSFRIVMQYFGSQVRLINVSPDKLYFKYDTNLVKKVPVILKADINFKPGYDMFNKYKLEPDSINVIGPKVLVSKIKNVETENSCFRIMLILIF